MNYSQFEIKQYNSLLNGSDILDHLYEYPELTIPLSPNSIFAPLTSTHHLSHPIAHQTPQINNPAPTLEQYYQQFKVFSTDLDPTTSTSPLPTNSLSSTELTHRQQMIRINKSVHLPLPSFFSNADDNFITSRFAHYYKNNDSKTRSSSTIYWYHYDSKTKNVNKFTLTQAKRLYATIYTKHATESHVFKIIHSQLHSNPQSKVIIYSHGAYSKYSNFSSQDDLKTFFNNESFDFPDCYCLLELLIHYPHVEKCLWTSNC